jgi:hypothetical protein
METMWTLLRITASYVPCNAIGFEFWSVYDVGPGTFQADFISSIVA